MGPGGKCGTQERSTERGDEPHFKRGQAGKPGGVVMVAYLIATPMAMVGVFVAFVTAPLLYEIVLYLRTRGDEAAVKVEVPVESRPSRKRRR
jgi:hypothetical protein